MPASEPTAQPSRKLRLGWLEAFDRRLPDDALVWDLTGGAGPATELLSKRHRYHAVVPDRHALAGPTRRAPEATFVEGTWETVEIEPGTADAVIAPASRKGSTADVQAFVERAAGWLKPGGYLLVNARPLDVAAYAPDSWLDAADEAEPRRAVPTAGALYEAGLEIRDYEFSPAKRGRQRKLWLIAVMPTERAEPRQERDAPRRFVDLPLRSQPLTVFVHIPKAAGTTFTEILQDNYPPDTVGRIGNLFKGGGGGYDPTVIERSKNAARLTLWMNVLAGHVPLGIHHYLPDDTRYITFLREPVDRVLSHFHVLITLKRGPNAVLPELDPDTPLPEVLENGRYIFDNLQTRMLCGDPEPLGEVTPEMLQAAKENLRSRILAFGLAEHFDESLVLIGRKLGLENLVYQRRRYNTGRPRTISDEISAYVRDFDRYDVELYDSARELFAQRVADEGEGFAEQVQALREVRATLEAAPKRQAAGKKPRRRTRGGKAKTT